MHSFTHNVSAHFSWTTNITYDNPFCHWQCYTEFSELCLKCSRSAACKNSLRKNPHFYDNIIILPSLLSQVAIPHAQPHEQTTNWYFKQTRVDTRQHLFSRNAAGGKLTAMLYIYSILQDFSNDVYSQCLHGNVVSMEVNTKIRQSIFTLVTWKFKIRAWSETFGHNSQY